MGIGVAGVGAGGVGIGPTEAGQDFGFERFHYLRIFRFDVIIAKQVQEAMNQKVADMPLEWPVHHFCVTKSRFISQRYIAKVLRLAGNFGLT